MRRFAANLVRRLQATRLQLLDVYGHAAIGCLSPPDRLVPEPFEVRSRRQDTADTWTLELAPSSGRAVRVCSRPVHDALGRRGPARCRSRSAAIPIAPQRLVHTVRAVGLATEAICAAAAGRMLGVRGPFGSRVAGRGGSRAATS